LNWLMNKKNSGVAVAKGRESESLFSWRLVWIITPNLEYSNSDNLESWTIVRSSTSKWSRWGLFNKQVRIAGLPSNLMTAARRATTARNLWILRSVMGSSWSLGRSLRIFHKPW
jgi:hypothetical protein